MFKKKRLSFAIVFVLFMTSTLQAADNIVLIWNQEALNLIQQHSVPPTIAARELAILHTCIYDAWAAYDKVAIGTRRGGTLRRPESEHTDANKQQAISFAAFRALSDLFPLDIPALVTLMNQQGYVASDTSEDPTTPTGIGNIVSLDVLNFRHFDGANQLGNEPGGNGPYSDYTGFTPVNRPTDLVNPSLWQPLIVNGIPQKCLTPQWGSIIPFALTAPDKFYPTILPATYPSDDYRKQAKQLLKLSADLNDRTKAIALYWADVSGTVTPPGHWDRFAQFVSRRDNHTLNEDAKLFFALENALFDVSIAVWYFKREFESVRPITAIHFLFNDKDVKAWAGPGLGTRIIQGEDWKSYIPTPSFPEFVSGHSTFSAAAAAVLRLFTGSDRFDNSAVVPKGSSFVEPGIAPTKDVTLSWKTFTQAANQAGISRRYGGIHFKDGDYAGRKLGKQIGKNAFRKAQFFFDGGINSNPRDHESADIRLHHLKKKLSNSK